MNLLLSQHGLSVNDEFDGIPFVFYVVLSGNISIVELFLDKGSSFYQSIDGETIFPLIDKFANKFKNDKVFFSKWSSYSPLQIALYTDAFNIAYLLVQHEVHVDFDKLINNPLFHSKNARFREQISTFLGITAIRKHDLKLIEKRIRKDFVVDTADEQGLTPLEHAVRDNYTEGVQFLLENSAKTTVAASEGGTVQDMVLNNFYFEYLKLFIQYSPSIKALGIKDKEHLDMIVNDRLYDLVEKYLQSAHDIDAVNKHNSTLLHNAVSTGQENLVRLALQYKPNLNLFDNSMETPLAIALKKGFMPIAELLINHGAIINDPRLAFLHRAISSGNLDIATFLLKHNADPNLPDKDGHLPLLLAVKMGDIRIIELLLKSQADINAHRPGGPTALMIACSNKQVALAEFLLAHKANIDIEWGVIKNFLFQAIEKNSLELVSLCIRYGGNINDFDIHGFTALHAACKIGSTDIVQFLLQQGAAIDAHLDDCSTPLMEALLNNKPQVAELLIKAGARIDLPLRGSSILQLCVQAHRNDAVRILLQQQAIRNQIEPQDTKWLETAIEKNDTILAGLLIPCYAITQEQGQKFLIMAMLHNNPEMVRLLFKNGVKGNARQLRQNCTNVGVDIFRELLLSGLSLEELVPEVVKSDVINYICNVIQPTRTFIAAAQKNDQSTCLNMLEHDTLEINLPDGRGNTALHYCVQQNSTQMVRELLMHGADPSIKNNEGCTPISYALPEILKIFITAATPIKEVNIRTVVQESKKLATLATASVNSYQVAYNRKSKIKTAANLISYLGYTLATGLMCLTAYKGGSVRGLQTFFKNAWEPFTAGLSTLAATTIISKLFKGPIASYFMHKPIESFITCHNTSQAQALILQQEIKNESHRKIAMQVFPDRLQVSDDKIRQGLINGFNPRNAQCLIRKLNELHARIDDSAYLP